MRCRLRLRQSKSASYAHPTERAEALAAYDQTYLNEEIQAEALVRSLRGSSRVLPIAALAHGQVVSAAGLSRDAGVARNTVVTYFDILEETLLGFRLHPYAAKLRVRERAHPKFYFVDAGLVRAIKRQRGALAQEEVGALFEDWVATTLRAMGHYGNLWDEMFHSAPPKAKVVEVDFLLQRGSELIAIEAKSSVRVDERHLRGLRAIGKLPSLRQRIVVYRGVDDGVKPDEIELLTVPSFVRRLAALR